MNNIMTLLYMESTRATQKQWLLTAWYLSMAVLCTSQSHDYIFWTYMSKTYVLLTLAMSNPMYLMLCSTGRNWFR